MFIRMDKLHRTTHPWLGNVYHIYRMCISIWIIGWIHGSTAAQREVRIGGVFEPENSAQIYALEYAINRINQRRDILHHSKLLYDIEESPAHDSFDVAKKVCRQLKNGVAGIFGPMSSQSAGHVQSICDALGIPHIETRWEPSEKVDYFSINLFPHYDALSKAYVDFVQTMGWNDFIILYQDNESLIRLQGLLNSAESANWKVKVRKLEPSIYNDYRPVLKDIKQARITRIIIDCDYKTLQTVLHQALTIRMMTNYFHYHATSLDLGLIDLDDFKHDGCNITAFRLIDPKNPQVQEVMNDWILQHVSHGRSPLENRRGMKTETALLYDAVFLFAKAYNELSKAQDLDTESLSCNKEKAWENGESLINFMKMIQLDGLTGMVKFDTRGRRTDFNLDLIELTKENGLRKMGSWDPVSGLNVTKLYNEVLKDAEETLKNRTLVVTTILEDPYMMKRDPNLEGNAKFEGYCVDLLEEVAKILHFNYSIKEVSDGNYGAPTGDNGEWNGMVKELMDGTADLAVASLTISYLREQVIDFTKPFMNLGISILFKKPVEKNPSLWSFLSPLSFDIWIYMVAAYVGVSIILFILARFSPYEWYNPHPCNPDSDVVENQFTLLNSFWFTVGSLMQQGSDLAPKAISTRLVSGVWWLFTLIIISSYTANLAAFLTVERMSAPIENADDLSKQVAIKYGTMWGGSTMTFFKTSSIPTYKRMWDYMAANEDEVFANSTKEGIKRVKEGNYAFLLESTMNEYTTERDCDLYKVGGLLDSKGYGVATPRGSAYRDLISNAILKLQEDQVLQLLYNKWWKEKGTAQCDAEDGKKKTNALAIANVGGVFLVLVGGLGLGIVIALFEFIYKKRKIARKHGHQISVCNEINRELRFAIKCHTGSSKPALKPPEIIERTNGENGMTMVPLNSGYMPQNQNYNQNHIMPPGDKYS